MNTPDNPGGSNSQFYIEDNSGRRREVAGDLRRWLNDDRDAPGAAQPRAAFNLGMGADSVAVWLRWEAQPELRPCPFSDLVVVTAMTGHEWPDTARLMAEHVLPGFREHGVRYVQLSRAGYSTEDGITVLSDSRSPDRMHMRGPVTLYGENRAAGTVVQSARRACSVKWKGWVIDKFLEAEAPGPFLQVMGYEANELGRAADDAERNTARRTGVYPLIEWGWDRAACEAYILARTGVAWPKSACVFCPYAFSQDSREKTLTRYAANPSAGLPALMMEHVALCLNHRQGLRGVRKKQGRFAGALTLMQLIRDDPRQGELLRLFEAELDVVPWHLYEVRRAYRKAGQAARSLRTLDTGSRSEMAAALRREAAAARAELASHDGIERAWIRQRADTYPTVEHLLAAAPADPAFTAVDKVGPAFAAEWDKALALSAPALW